MLFIYLQWTTGKSKEKVKMKDLRAHIMFFMPTTDFCCKTNTHVININICVAHVKYDLLLKSNPRNNHISPDAEQLSRQMLLCIACKNPCITQLGFRFVFIPNNNWYLISNYIVINR